MPFPNVRGLTDRQWTILDPLIPEPRQREDRRGRPWKSRRGVLGGILWVLRTGAPWVDLPHVYPSYQTLPPADFNNGCGPASCGVSSKLWLRICRVKISLTSAKPSLMAALPQVKRERESW